MKITPLLAFVRAHRRQPSIARERPNEIEHAPAPAAHQIVGRESKGEMPSRRPRRSLQ